MGKGGGSGTGAHDYFGTIAGVACAGPAFGLAGLICDGKLVWPGADEWKASQGHSVGGLVKHSSRVWKCVQAHTSAPGNAPPHASYWTLFYVPRAGSPNPYPFSVEGWGTAYLYWGTADQTLDTVGEKILSQQGHPPYRRQVVVILKDFLFGRERTSAPNVQVVLLRAPQQTLITGSPAQLDADNQANPLAAQADLLTDPVFGVAQANSFLHSSTWQSAANALAADGAKHNLSVLLDRNQSVRSFLAEVLAYYDGWHRWRSDATQIEAGRFLHNEAPPAFTDATTIDFHDLIEEVEFSTDGWAETTNETLVKFKDASRAWKDASVVAVHGCNRALVGEPRQTSVERPWITRRQQAADYAAEHAKVMAEPRIAGTLVVRLEKAAAITPGTVFRLTHDALSLSIACRCIEKTIHAPPARRVSIRFESERAISALPYQPTPAALGGPAWPAPETVSLREILQLPPSLTGGEDYRIAVLAARTSALTVGLSVWLQKDDASLFYRLGQQNGWAVHGTLAQAYASTLPEDGTEPPDDETEILQLNLHASTPAADIEGVSEDQSEDAVNDSSLLIFLVSAADPHLFEICAVKSSRADAGVHKLKVRRARFGTPKRSFATGDRAWIIHREALVSCAHDAFAAYAPAGSTAVFRLQARTAANEADLSDPVQCPDVAYTFVDPYAPQVTWQVFKVNGAVASIEDSVLPTDGLSVTWQMTDANGDLESFALEARLGSTKLTLLAGPIPPSGSASRTCCFKLATEADWRLVAIVRDRSGRTTESEFGPIQVRAAASTTVASPIATPGSGTYSSFPRTITLTCSTSGATIRYQIVSLFAQPGATWTDYSTAFAIAPNQTLYAKAVKDGMTASWVSQEDYEYWPIGYPVP